MSIKSATIRGDLEGAYPRACDSIRSKGKASVPCSRGSRSLAIEFCRPSRSRFDDDMAAPIFEDESA